MFWIRVPYALRCQDGARFGVELSEDGVPQLVMVDAVGAVTSFKMHHKSFEQVLEIVDDAQQRLINAGHVVLEVSPQEE